MEAAVLTAGLRGTEAPGRRGAAGDGATGLRVGATGGDAKVAAGLAAPDAVDEAGADAAEAEPEARDGEAPEGRAFRKSWTQWTLKKTINSLKSSGHLPLSRKPQSASNDAAEQSLQPRASAAVRKWRLQAHRTKNDGWEAEMGNKDRQHCANRSIDVGVEACAPRHAVVQVNPREVGLRQLGGSRHFGELLALVTLDLDHPQAAILLNDRAGFASLTLPSVIQH